MRNVIFNKRQFLAIWISILMIAASIAAQTTTFTFQGRLNTSGSPASGTYEMQFEMFDSVKGGAQVGKSFTDPSVAVVNGIFTTTLDFGAAAFDGSARYVEIGVRPAGNTDPFTILAPRQTIKSAPYSIQSKNAATADGLSANCVNCVTSAQIETIDGAQITGVLPTVTIPSGSDNYIQNAAVARSNGKDGVQPMASLNIGGNATVGSLDVNGPASFAAVGAPAVAPAGQGRIYFDSGTNKVKVSENGGAFVDLVGATGVSGSGTVNSLPLWSAGTTLGNSGISQTAAGNVGIGTTTPAFKFTVKTATGNYGLNHTDGTISIGSYLGNSTSGATGGWFGTLSNNPLHFFTNGGQPAVTISTAGNVGVGTFNPTAKLEVAATGDGAALLQLSTERPWVFRQAYTGPSTGLRLQSTSGLKNFEITALGGTNIATFLADDAFPRVGIGTTNPTATLHVIGTTRSSVVEITGGSDLAEKFSFSEIVKPGMVVAIDAKNAGKLKLARGVYNRQVAGVISGANDLSAGMTLPDLKNSADGIPVALSGRVWVYCDATKHSIAPGDLLTTAVTPGHAMKATNHVRAQGAILGKAMTSLKTGRGLVLVLVTLQ